MSKQEFMEELKILLEELPIEEREEALRYYDSYFEEAGIDQEQIVIDELGSAQRIAAQILREYREERTAGIYTEQGYQEQELPKETPIRYIGEENEQSEQRVQTEGTPNSGVKIKNKGLSGATLAIVIILLILTFPIWIGLFGIIFGILMGLLGGGIGLVVGFGAGGVGCLIGGVSLFVVGLVKIVTLPVLGIAFVAGGLILFGAGCLMVAATGGIIRLAVWVISAIVKGLGSLFHGGQGRTV